MPPSRLEKNPPPPPPHPLEPNPPPPPLMPRTKLIKSAMTTTPATITSPTVSNDHPELCDEELITRGCWTGTPGVVVRDTVPGDVWRLLRIVRSINATPERSPSSYLSSRKLDWITFTS